MTGRISQIDNYHQTKKGKLVFGAAELLVAYLIISRAIDTGSLWQYGLALLFFIGGANNLAKAALGSNKTYVKSKKR
ncbi:hypothetical protein KY385_03825 [Candidatus Parcubacteria bacterium]|nr:hypothetical protein [Candidatus Parcubacteria bacterium]